MGTKRAVGSRQWAVAADAPRRRARSPLSLPTAHSQLPTLRRGISLLEVLISMFVLLFGLMGVASIFPVGNHHAGKGDQYDRGAAMTESAVAELHARGMLRPGVWLYADNTRVIDPATFAFQYPVPTSGSMPGPGYAFVIDPMGSAGVTDNYFPANAEGGTNPWSSGTPSIFGNQWPIRRLSLAQADGNKLSTPVAETIFRLRDDLANELPKEGDRPGIQRWAASDPNGTPKVFTDDLLLQRQYSGSYSWLATITPTAARSAANPNLPGVADLQPHSGMAGSALYEVSVAVFFKRARLTTGDAEAERLLTATLYPGGELEMSAPNAPALEAALKDIRSSQWIALAGVNPNNGQFLLKWYRLLSLDEEPEVSGSVAIRRAMLDGPDWPMDDPTAGTQQATNLRAILLPGIINVSTQVVAMERE